MTYDSRPETYEHMLRVAELMMQLVKEALDRAVNHDRSKVREPELSIFDQYTPKLEGVTYGTDEYFQHLKDMGPALDHHYQHNRHHPQHFPDGIDGMNLVDLLEVLADWKAASERHADGDLRESLLRNQTRFEIGDQLLGILANTAEHFGWFERGRSVA